MSEPKRIFECETGCGCAYTLKFTEPWPKKCSQCGEPVTKRSIPIEAFEGKTIKDIGGLAPGSAIVTTQEFVKYDEDKPDWRLLPPEVMEGIVMVLMHGAKKYDTFNWKKGTDWHRYYNAALRHLTAFWIGEDIDPDSELHHLDHALCCLVFLRYFTMYPEYKKHDNRREGSEVSTVREESGHGN